MYQNTKSCRYPVHVVANRESFEDARADQHADRSATRCPCPNRLTPPPTASRKLRTPSRRRGLSGGNTGGKGAPGVPLHPAPAGRSALSWLSRAAKKTPAVRGRDADLDSGLTRWGGGYTKVIADARRPHVSAGTYSRVPAGFTRQRAS